MSSSKTRTGHVSTAAVDRAAPEEGLQIDSDCPGITCRRLTSVLCVCCGHDACLENHHTRLAGAQLVVVVHSSIWCSCGSRWPTKIALDLSPTMDACTMLANEAASVIVAFDTQWHGEMTSPHGIELPERAR